MSSRRCARVLIELEGRDAVVGTSSVPRFLLRWMLRRCARGQGPTLLELSEQHGREVPLKPGTVTGFLVAAYEGPQ
jgi:hypothetical protein